jgi:NTP pyrophosphatase (non-canonical NTP hydrolase)
MNLDDLITFSQDQANHLRRQYPALAADPEKWAYAQAIKLGEEVGELNEAILARFLLQRSSKSHKTYDLEGELADVVIVAFILARQLDVDLAAALERKITTLKIRRQE